MTNEQLFFQEAEVLNTALLPHSFIQRLDLTNGEVSCFCMLVMLQRHITQYAQNIVSFDLQKVLDIIALTHDIYVNKFLFGLCTFVSQDTWKIVRSCAFQIFRVIAWYDLDFVLWILALQKTGQICTFQTYKVEDGVACYSFYVIVLSLYIYC